MEAAGKRYIAYPSRSDEFTIWNISDVHWWAAACAKNRLRRDIKAIEDDPYAFWLSTGDLGEYIPYNDKRFDPEAVRGDLQIRDLGKVGAALGKELEELFAPIAGKCLGLGMGNHEWKYMLACNQQHLHEWLCEHLGVPSLGYSSLFDLVFMRQPRRRGPRVMDGPSNNFSMVKFRVYTHHGAGWANTKGGKLNRLLKFMNDHEADMYFMGHVHEQQGTRQTRIAADDSCSRLVDRQAVGVISGAYLETYHQGTTTYGEIRGYSPSSLGAAWIRVKPETRELWGRV